MKLAVALLVATGGSPSLAARTRHAPAAAPDAAAHIQLARLRVRDVDAQRFEAALALRLPDVKLVPHDREAPALGDGALAVFVDVGRSATPDAFALTIVVSDGRAYDRVVAVEPGAPSDDVTRLLASHVGNLVSGIEAGTARPDRENVPMPVEPIAPVEPLRCPAPPPAKPCPAPAKPATPIPPPTVELGVDGAAVAILGLGRPGDSDRFAAWGGGVGLHMRHRSGASVLVDVRVSGRALPFDLRMARARVALGVGYVLRVRSFELESTVAFTVEPWFLRHEGAESSLADRNGSGRDAEPLLGGFVRLVPGHVFRVKDELQLRIGPRFELGASSAAGDHGRVAQLQIVQGDTRVEAGRVGGIELALGLDVTLWIGIRRRAASGSRAR
ncbi:MAG TPA: hypothetical protein VG755_16850 [Nannocystaceae bacterium]|nr:hypothetical protein [Nannocystaceae bacterium]